ncbi:MAG: NTP transferase domain-containing protein [Candidatus Sumerlaeia bacterium]|nr:NTP transferase domain-containing protein [Candidatus Sumerlaeia bacterium]
MADGAAAIVLAAGEGKRMKTSLPKVLHPVLGVPMLHRVVRALSGAGVARIVVVIGHAADAVRASLDGLGVSTALQAEQLGTGHAARCALPELEGWAGPVVVACGDTPLVTAELFRGALDAHAAAGAAATVVTCRVPQPGSYGRIVRGVGGGVEAIMEFRDASAEQRAIDEINSGNYVFSGGILPDYLAQLRADNSQREYYLTDVVGLLRKGGSAVAGFMRPDFRELLGVNSLAELADAENILSTAAAARLMASGVAVRSPATCRIAPEAEVGRDSVVLPGVSLEGACRLGERCVVGPNVVLRDAVLPAGTRVSPLGVEMESPLARGAAEG